MAAPFIDRDGQAGEAGEAGQAPHREERRRYPRFPLALCGLCSVAGGPDAACTTLDLSLGGVALRTAARAEAGDRVVLMLPRVGVLEGRAVRALPEGIALAFAASRSQRARLTRLLAASLTGTGPAQGEQTACGAAEPWSLTRMLRA